MREIETSARTVEEAIESALTSLGIKRSNADIRVVSEPIAGLLGLIGHKSARVVVKVRYEPKEYLERFIKELLGNMGLRAAVEIQEDEEKIAVSIKGGRVGMLIGRRGKTLNELQYLLNAVFRRQFTRYRKMVLLDVEGYRNRRERTLVKLAGSIARKVSQEGRAQELEPMTPQERRIIHLALQEHAGVKTYSKGEEPNRKVVIAPR